MDMHLDSWWHSACPVPGQDNAFSVVEKRGLVHLHSFMHIQYRQTLTHTHTHTCTCTQTNIPMDSLSWKE